MEDTTTKYPIKKLLFRRQFILGPKFIENLPYWKRIKIRDEILISIHPDLDVHQIVYEDSSLTLLGFMLDPVEPSANNIDILKSLIGKLLASKDLNSFFKNTYTLGGRWVLIIDDGNEIRLLNDTTGYRQVFYTDLSICEQLWCASQPGIIAEILNLDMDKDALEFLDLDKYKHWGNKEYVFPGESSLYKEIKHLLPNHYLNLRTGSCCRFWPDRNLDEMPLDECIQKSARILKGLMRSALNRFDLALSITAGRDTRLILAVSREISDRLYYFTHMHWSLSESSADIKIPARLLSRLGLRHNIIKCPQKINAELKRLYKRNVTAAHQVYEGIFQGMYNSYPENRVCVKGNAIPIVKCHFHQSSNNGNANSSTLARLLKVEGCSFAMHDFEKWLSDARDIYNVNILDLFSWEIKDGNWQAMAQLEFDIIHEVFVPFNCRRLLIDMLSVDREYRKPPDYKLHTELITLLWPELLMEPINPKPKKRITTRIKNKIIGAGRRIKSIMDKV